MTELEVLEATLREARFASMLLLAIAAFTIARIFK